MTSSQGCGTGDYPCLRLRANWQLAAGPFGFSGRSDFLDAANDLGDLDVGVEVTLECSTLKRLRCSRHSADGFLYCGLKIGVQPQQLCVVVAFCYLPLTPAVRQQPRLLPQRHDAPGRRLTVSSNAARATRYSPVSAINSSTWVSVLSHCSTM